MCSSKIEVLSKQLSYWNKRLFDAAILALPSKPRPQEQSYKGSYYEQYLPRKTLDRLNQIAKEKNVTLFIMLLSAFKGVLSKVCNQNDIVIGTLTANRKMEGTENLIGLFKNKLALRTDCSNNPTFEELIKRAEKTVLEAYEHRDLPFEQLIEHLDLPKDLSRHPLFQVVFVSQNVEEEQIRFGGLELTHIRRKPVLSKFDLIVNVIETTEGLCFRYEYATDLFDERHIESLNNYYIRFIKQILCNLEVSLSEIQILDQAELNQLESWNNTKVEYPKDKCVHELFEKVVENRKDKTAIIHRGQHLAYKELNERANQLAHFLRDQGVGPETLVAIACDRSLDIIVGILAILKAGGCYVPLDPSYPLERLAYIMEDTQSPILLTQSHLIEKLPKTEAKVVLLDNSVVFKDYPISNLGRISQYCHLYYIVYTSGSTGKPKGVMIEQGALCDRLFWWSDYIPLTTEDRCLHQFSFSVDSAAVSLWWPLLNGAPIILPESHELSDIKYLANTIKRHKITTIFCTPSMMNVILDQKEIQESTYIRRLLFGGEIFTRGIFKKAQKFINCKIYNLYGPAECTIITSGYDTTNKECIASTVPIGKPVANVQVYVLDSLLNRVPIGTIGELYIGGVGVARGYLNREDLTAEKIIENPFVNADDKKAKRNLRIYASGDLCRWLEDGNLEYIGRIDDQVKLRGFRIELGEVE